MYLVKLSQVVNGVRSGKVFDVVNVLHSGAIYCYNVKPGNFDHPYKAIDEVWLNQDQWVQIERIEE